MLIGFVQLFYIETKNTLAVNLYRCMLCFHLTSWKQNCNFHSIESYSLWFLLTFSITICSPVGLWSLARLSFVQKLEYMSILFHFQEDVAWSALVKLFDPVQSPRCYALVALKKQRWPQWRQVASQLVWGLTSKITFLNIYILNNCYTLSNKIMAHNVRS